ncbi:MAG: hypothetical protein ACIAXF_06190 [Phycisphaerales bacterium JB063]
MSDESVENQIKPQLDAISSRLDQIDRMLRGNGQQGLTVRVAVLESAMNSANKLMWLVLATCVSSIGAALVAFLSNLGD